MSDKPKPVYLIAGGRGMERRKGPDPLLQAALGLDGSSGKTAGRPPEHRPSVAYVGAASGDNAVFRVWVTRLFQKAGAGPVTLAPLCGKRADPRKARAVLEEADIVFVSGGDVEEGMRVLEETEMIEPLRLLYRQGKPFFGVSAGSIMLARQWVRWRDPHDDATAELFPCLGIARVFCDTHGEGDGWEELKALVRLAPPRAIGHGIVSGSALVVGPGGKVSALGGEIDRFARKAGEAARIESLREDRPGR
jgi:cyanophycinase-like exopeptidase